MKTSPSSALAVVCGVAAAAAAVFAADPCDMGAIESKLFPNATEGLKMCEAATGINVLELSEYPTKNQTQTLQKNVDCVNYINQINQEANSLIRCERQVSGDTVIYADMLTALLEGRTGNASEVESESGSISLPESDSASESDSDMDSESASTSESESGSSGDDSGVDEDAQGSDEDRNAKSGAGGARTATTISAVVTTVAAALAFAL